MMRAVAMTKYGKDQARLMDIPEPTPDDLQSGQLLVHVLAVALNPADAKIRSGKVHALAHKPTSTTPAVLGYDFSGVVVAAAPDTKETFALGDEVFGVSFPGALAPRRVVYADMVAPKPKSLSHGEAACLVTAGTTALQMLDRARELVGAPLSKVLITAGGGGVGHLAVQFAKHYRSIPTVVATTSPGKAVLVRSLGADRVMDYTQGDYLQALRSETEPFDAVLDLIGEPKHLRTILHPDRPGAVVSCMSRFPPGHMVERVTQAYHLQPVPKVFLKLLTVANTCAYGGRVPIDSIIMLPQSAELARVAHAMAEGRARVVMSRTCGIEDAVEALDDVERGHTAGKVIVEVVPGAAAGPRAPAAPSDTPQDLHIAAAEC